MTIGQQTPGTRPPAPASLDAAFRDRARPFTTVVEAVEDWDAPSPCAGWSARDVLEHVLSTQREFLAARGHPVPGGADEEPARAWAAHHREVDALLADPDVAGQPYDSAFGPSTLGATLIEFYGFDLIVHRWDIARSQGLDERFTPQEITLIDAAVDSWGEHAYAPGIFAHALPVAPEADAQARVLARMGRMGRMGRSS
ncbi:TIGR03086 family metal-binding protein [Brachybacterium paraconglomeratum]|uniref:TIGR03086 family metal-binding protein n=1 Tax=Brachybacterium paraconglomeratum TaxID=173362 RepID=UPI0031F11E77